MFFKIFLALEEFFMLLGGIAVVSLAAAAAVCFGFDAFAGLSWLWMLPAAFAGTYLVGLILAFLFLLIVCQRVDLDKEEENDSPFYRKIARVYVEAILKLVQARVHTEGLEQTPKEGRFLLVCNHLNIMDPVLLLHYFRDSQLAFISKRENANMFIVGKLIHKLLCQYINRENDREAMKTILKCISIIKEDKASIAVFPEGYTSRDGKLQHFRSGVFKIAQKANVPIAVCTVQNTKSILHNAIRLKPTHVELHLVGVIPPQELKGITATEVGERVHRMMADDLGPELVAAK